MPQPDTMVSYEQVQDYVRQEKKEAEGYTNIQSENLQKVLNGELQKVMGPAEATDEMVELLGQESGRAMRLVLAESE